VALGLIAAAAPLAGCGSTIASLPLIGEPPEAQNNRPASTSEYPEAFVKPASEAKAMTAAERAKAEAELTTARDKSAAERRQQINQPNPR
jgi:hypothetical protein